jgi:hypothetical protein
LQETSKNTAFKSNEKNLVSEAIPPNKQPFEEPGEKEPTAAEPSQMLAATENASRQEKSGEKKE